MKAKSTRQDPDVIKRRWAARRRPITCAVCGVLLEQSELIDFRQIFLTLRVEPLSRRSSVSCLHRLPMSRDCGIRALHGIRTCCRRPIVARWQQNERRRIEQTAASLRPVGGAFAPACRLSPAGVGTGVEPVTSRFTVWRSTSELTDWHRLRHTPITEHTRLTIIVERRTPLARRYQSLKFLTERPRQESNLVHDLRGVACNPAQSEDNNRRGGS